MDGLFIDWLGERDGAKTSMSLPLRAAAPSRITPGDPVEPGSHPSSPTMTKGHPFGWPFVIGWGTRIRT